MVNYCFFVFPSTEPTFLPARIVLLLLWVPTESLHPGLLQIIHVHVLS